jgi:phage gp46-like protein
MNLDGDVLLKTSDTGDIDINISNGQPEMTTGLENASFLSIFSNDWWGNAVTDDDDEKFDSEFELVLSKNLSNFTRLEAQDRALDALKWMETSGIVKKINIEAKILSLNNLSILINFEQPDSSSSTIFGINWNEMRVRIE